MKNGFLPALTRFWWVMILVLGIGGVVAIASVDRISLSAPPKLTPRGHPSYSASAELLVDSPSSPFLRTAVSSVSKGQTRTETIAGKTVSKSSPTVVSSAPPHTETLVNAANLFPLLIESDGVAKVRAHLFGPLPGSVTAQAVFASQNTFGQFRPSPVPVVTVSATSTSGPLAIKLANGTVTAFRHWLTARQSASAVGRPDRIVIQELSSAGAAYKHGGTSLGLPGILFVVVLVAFGGLAILLDRLFPAVREVEARVVRPHSGDGSSAVEAPTAVASGPRI